MQCRDFGTCLLAARAKIAAAENDVRVWDETQRECELAVRAKEADVAAAKERVEKAARMVVCNAETVSHLADELDALQSELISRGPCSGLSGARINGELSVPLAERIERLLWRDLTGLESTSASAAWSAAFEELHDKFRSGTSSLNLRGQFNVLAQRVRLGCSFPAPSWSALAFRTKVAAAALGGQHPGVAAFYCIACVSPFRSRVRTSPASVW